MKVYGPLLGEEIADGQAATVVPNHGTLGPPEGWLTVVYERGEKCFTKHVHPKQCRRLVKKDPTVWLNADHVDLMRSTGEPRTVNASPHETRMGQRWEAYRPVKEFSRKSNQVKE